MTLFDETRLSEVIPPSLAEGELHEFMELARDARACLTDVRLLAARLVDLPINKLESLLQSLLDLGEDQALSRVLQASAVNQVRLTPELLCRCIGVCQEFPDTAPCFAFQGADAIAPLLSASAAPDLSEERLAYVIRLAAELCKKFNQNPQPVHKALKRLERSIHTPVARLLLEQTWPVLQPGPKIDRFTHFSEMRLDDLLPEQPPHPVVGGLYTVRRPIPKLGRNEPCHCGSGKKYKKCCFAKDQERLRDASEYVGATRSELKHNPGLVDDPGIIDELRAYELKRLQPVDLGTRQLIAGYRRALEFGLRELAFDMLVERQGRDAQEEFDPGHFDDLLEAVLAAGDLDLARAIKAHCQGHEWYQPSAIAFRFELLEQPEHFTTLERDCRNAVCERVGDDPLIEDPLIRLAYDFAHQLPGLATVFARAAILSNPERRFDNEMLLEVIRDARVDLDLEANDDPAEAWYDWIEERSRIEAREREDNRQLSDLSAKLQNSRKEIEKNRHALRESEQLAEELTNKLALTREAALSVGEPKVQNADQEHKLQLLRAKVEDLKAIIDGQQEERGRLRKMLADERNRQSPSPTPTVNGDNGKKEEESPQPHGRPIPPEFSADFHKSCRALPPATISKALLAAGRFAAHDSEIWRKTKPLERLPGYYRIRVDASHRLLLYWRAGQELRILDLIPRQELESWIKRHG